MSVHPMRPCCVPGRGPGRPVPLQSVRRSACWPLGTVRGHRGGLRCRVPVRLAGLASRAPGLARIALPAPHAVPCPLPDARRPDPLVAEPAVSRRGFAWGQKHTQRLRDRCGKGADLPRRLGTFALGTPARACVGAIVGTALAVPPDVGDTLFNPLRPAPPIGWQTAAA